ncbi:MAG: ABC transporter ATP-binding protein [Infirmifilum sp.]
MLSCVDLWVSLPGTGEVLKGVDFEVRPGEIAVLLGPNGSGKSTLILALAGLLKPQRGRVFLDGVELQSQLPWARRRIGVVFQDPDDQLFNPTVEDELLFTLNQLDLGEGEKRERLEEVATLLSINHLLKRPVYALSFGEKRRVALASVLVYDPQYLLLDEPTANLDSKSLAALLGLVCTLKSQGKGVLVATQDSNLAERMASRLYVLVDGKILWRGEGSVPLEVKEAAGLNYEIPACTR